MGCVFEASRRTLCTAASALLLAGCSIARAALDPTPPVRLVVGASPNGPTDVLARLFADVVGDALGQRFVVDNRPGAGGTLAAAVAAKAPADGRTLLVAGPASVVVAPWLYRGLAYDPARDFAAVALLGESALVLAAHPSVPARSVHELIELARRNPRALAYASAGNGSTSHLSAELFSSRTGIRMLHVPYRGDAQAQNDLLGGDVQLMFIAPNVALPQVRTGRLRALAVTALHRLPSMPGVPTVDESGLRDFEYSAWIAAFAPAGTPRAVVDRIGSAWEATRSQPAALARIEQSGMTQPRRTVDRDGLTAFFRTERLRLAAVIHEAGIRPQ